jgi:predicted nucleic acid-binding protein
VVVDASVAVKWFVTEKDSGRASSLAADSVGLLAPTLLLAEVANALLKKVNRGEMPPEAALADLSVLGSRVEFRPLELVIEPALRLALEHGRTVYDALYVALALHERCQVITADERLYNSLRRPFGETLVWLGDLPASAV